MMREKMPRATCGFGHRRDPPALSVPASRRAQAIDAQLAGKSYVESSVDGWVNAICEDVIAALVELQRPFKYIGAAWDHFPSTRTPALTRRRLHPPQ